MRFPRPRHALALALAATTSLIVAPHDATATPQIVRNSVTVTPDTATADATVTVRFRVTDTAPGSRFGSGFLWVSRGFPAPATLFSRSFGLEHLTAGDRRDGTFAVPVDLPVDATPGTWDILVRATGEDGAEGNIEFNIRALTVSTDPPDLAGAPVLSNFQTDTTSVDLTHTHGRVIVSFDLTDPDGVEPPILRLFLGTDAREYQLTETHRTATGGDTSTFRYTVWLPPRLPSDTYNWSVVATDGGGDAAERPGDTLSSIAVQTGGDSSLIAIANNIDDPMDLEPGLELDSDTLDLALPDPEITGSFDFVDATAGFARATVFLAGPATRDRIELHLDAGDITAGDASAGSVRFAFPVPPHAAEGLYLPGVDLFDVAGNQVTYGGVAGEPLPFGSTDEITLTNQQPAPPSGPFTVTGVRLTGTEINLTDNPADVALEIDITDPDGTFRTATATATPFIAAAPQRAVAVATPGDAVAVDGDSMTLRTAIHFPTGAIPGTWTVRLALEGTANSTAADIGSVEVTSFGGIDTTAPALTSLATDTPVVDVTGATTTAAFTLGLAGFAAPDHGTLTFSNPDQPGLAVGPVPFTVADRTAGDDNASTATVAVAFPAGTPPGTWYAHVALADPYTLGNAYGGTDPAAAPPLPDGSPGTVTVVDSGTPPYDAFLANHPSLAATGPSADPDHDTLPNALELLLGTDPTVPTFPSPLELSTTATHLRLTFPVDRAALDTGNGAPVTFSGRVSTTLKNSNALTPVPLANGRFRLETPLVPGTSRFLSLEVTP